tara:strand:- start:159 stop:491 length:333 start_codon:yes stop_codon:yes gene_type:complete
MESNIVFTVLTASDGLSLLRPEDWDGPSHKQGMLYDVSAKDIEDILGEANSEDDTDKVNESWRFVVRVDDSEDILCNIWDWYGSGDTNEWSFFGPSFIMTSLFGENHVRL